MEICNAGNVTVYYTNIVYMRRMEKCRNKGQGWGRRRKTRNRRQMVCDKRCAVNGVKEEMDKQKGEKERKERTKEKEMEENEGDGEGRENEGEERENEGEKGYD